MTHSPVIIIVYGEAKPAGSKRAFLNRKTGRPIVTDDCKASRPWKTLVQSMAQEQYRGPLLSGPLKVSMTFRIDRPTGHYGTGRNAELLRASAPRKPVKRPDVLKLARAVEDALTGIVWTDDAVITDERITKVYGARGERPGVCVIVGADSSN